MQPKNYIKYIPLILLYTVAILAIASTFGDGATGNNKIKKTDIFRDITPKEQHSSDSIAIDIAEQETTKKQTKEETETKEQTKKTKQKTIQKKNKIEPNNNIIAIEDYSKEKRYIEQFRNNIKNAKENNFRIAFLGDSYIEGDILTMDLRRKLQEQFGGEGVGFVPITSPVSRYRTSIDHSYTDMWKSENATKKSDAGDYILSGYKFKPIKNSSVIYEMSNLYSTLKSVEKATLLYIAQDDAEVEVYVNDGEKKMFELPKKDKLESLTINSKKIKSIQYNFKENKELTLYGVMLDGEKGVSLDNFALRGEKGNLPSIISKRRIVELSEIASYELIVIQYGLNFSYITEEKQLRHHSNILSNGIEKLKECYPNTPIMIMGVGPMMTKDDDGHMVVKPNIYEVEKMLRKIAIESGSMFWSTIDAVDSLGGMELFVKNKWAAKDYTHMTALGGKKLADMLYEALINEEVIIDK